MRYLRTVTMLMLTASLLFAFAACGHSDPANSATKIIRLGLVTGPTSAQNIAAQHFAELVKQRTHGSVTVQIFPNSQLGSSASMLQSLATGTVQMTITVTADTIVPKMQVFELPYLFPDEQTAVKVANGSIATSLNELFIPKGMRVLANWDSGFRHVITTNRDVTDINSMKGMRIRIINSPIWDTMFKALGAVPVAMDYNQVYTGLQQGVIESVENPLSNLYGAHFYEVAKHLSLTQHSFGAATVLLSDKFWRSLTADEQQAVSSAAQDTVNYETQLTLKQEQDFLAEMQKQGVKITRPALDPFQTVTKVVYDKLTPTLGADLIQQVQQAVKSSS